MIAALIFSAAVANAPFMRLNVEVAEYGLRGTGTILVDRRSGRYVRHFDVGPATDGDGFDGTDAWSSDAGNAVYRQGNADTRAQIMAWSKLFTRLGTPALPRRVSLRVGNDTQTIVFEDAPSRIIVHDQGGTRVITVTRAELLRSIAPGAFAPPALPHDFGIEGGAAVASVPLLEERLGQRRLPLLVIPACVNGGAPMRLLVDTGGQNILSSTAGRQLHIKDQGSMNIGGTGADTQHASLAIVDTLAIGNAHLRHQSFTILPLESLLPDIDGIVGAELFSRFAARIDYRNHRLSLASEAPPSWAESATAQRIAFNKNMPAIAGSADNLPGQFTLDTGSVGGLDLNAPFAAEHNLYKYYGATEDGHATGVGGSVQTARVRVDRVQLEALQLFDVPATLAYKGGGVTDDPTVAGNIGEKIFGLYREVIFDYPHQSLTMLK